MTTPTRVNTRVVQISSEVQGRLLRCLAPGEVEGSDAAGEELCHLLVVVGGYLYLADDYRLHGCRGSGHHRHHRFR